MGAANLTHHNKIILTKVNNQSGVGPNATYPEALLQTFYDGSPVYVGLAASDPGYVKVWTGDIATQPIAGFASQPGSNLASNGLGYMLPFGTDGFPGSAVLDPVGVQFQPNAVVIPPGARATNGSQNIQLGVAESWFEAQVDNSDGTIAANYETSYALVGQQAGLTSDGNGTWYVDLYADAAPVVQIVELNPIDGPGNVSGMLNGRVRFILLPASYQFGTWTAT